MAANLIPLSALSHRRPATDAEYAQWLAASQMPGAPADFGGPVFANPDGIQVSADTDSGIPVTRLPNGVTFQRGNWHGATPTDISNPPKAQLTTTAAMSSAPQIDFSKYESTAPPAGKIDFSKYEPASQSTDDVGFLDREIPLTSYSNATLSGLQSLGRSARNAGKGLVDLVKPPQDEIETAIAGHPAGQAALPIYRTLRAIGHTAADSTQVLDAIKDINASPDPAGSYAKALQEMSSDGAVQALTALATEGVIRGIPKVPAAASAASDAIKTGVNAGSKAVRAINPVVQALDPDIVGIVSPRAGNSLRVAQRASKVANKYARRSAESVPVTPGEAEPFEGQTSSQTEGAGDVVEQSPTETPAQVLTRGGSTAELEKALNDALGGKPLQKGVSLRNQGKAPAAAADSSLPQGFTSVDSSAVQGYKYDSAAREFETVTKDGRHYIHGDVSPEDAASFEAADSKGKAWQQIRNNPLVAKVVDGKRIPIVKSAGPQSPVMQKAENLSDFIRPQKTLKDLGKPTAAPTAAEEPDLLSQLQQSLDQAKAKNAGVTTTAKPSDLLDRWGVDPKSFAAGREQTRGMSAEDSAAAIDKIAEGYKQGQKIEPVIEVRDGQNNLIEVDGRSRVLAAHKAGIKRIPIIVRRLQ